MRSANIERANAAVAFGKWVGVVCALTLAFIGLGHVALIGDELRAERIGIPEEQRSEWSDYPNDSHCNWNCIERIGRE